MALTRSWQNIGGAKHEMRKKSTRSIRGNYARLRIKEGWVFGTLIFLT